jgi:MFS family permease
VHLLRRRWFAVLAAGLAIDAAGTWAALIALWGFAAYKFDASPAQIALLGMSWAAPAALLGPFAGVPVDRLGPRKVLVGAQLLGAASALSMLGANSWTYLVVVGLGTGVAKAFLYPAADALPPRVVDEADLLAANSVLGAATDSAIVFGPVIAAGAIAVAGLRGAFVIDAATYLVGMAVVLPLRLRPLPTPAPVDPATLDIAAPPAHPVRQILREIGDGVRVARTTPVLRWTLVLSAFVYLTWGTFVVVEPLYARDVVHASPTTFAMFQAVFGTVLVVAGLLLPRLGRRVTSAGMLAWTVALSGIAASIYVGTHVLVVAFVGVGLWGLDVAFFAAPSRTILQANADPTMHGRVLALNRTLHNLADLVALPLAGLAMGWIGPQGTGVAVGALAFTAGVVGFRARPRPQEAPVDNARKSQGFTPSIPQAELRTVEACPPTGSSSRTTASR